MSNVDFDVLRVAVQELALKKQRMAELDDEVGVGMQGIEKALNSLNLGFPVEFTYSYSIDDDEGAGDALAIGWWKHHRGNWRFVHVRYPGDGNGQPECLEFSSCSRDVRLAIARVLPAFVAEIMKQLDDKIREREEALQGLRELATVLSPHEPHTKK